MKPKIVVILILAALVVIAAVLQDVIPCSLVPVHQTSCLHVPEKIVSTVLVTPVLDSGLLIRPSVLSMFKLPDRRLPPRF